MRREECEECEKGVWDLRACLIFKIQVEGGGFGAG